MIRLGSMDLPVLKSYQYFVFLVDTNVMKPSLTWTQYSSLTYNYILYLRMTFFQSSPLFKRCTSLSGKGSSQDDGLCSVSPPEKTPFIWSKVPKLIAPGTIAIDWLLYLFSSKTAPFWPWIYLDVWFWKNKNKILGTWNSLFAH